MAQEYITLITGRYLVVTTDHSPITQTEGGLVIYPDTVSLSRLRETCVCQSEDPGQAANYKWKYKILMLTWKQYIDVTFSDHNLNQIATKIKNKQTPWDFLYLMSDDAQGRLVIALS